MKNRKTIVLVSGWKRSGKDHVSSGLNRLIVDSTICSFANPLKDIMAMTLNLSLLELNELKNEEAHVSCGGEDTTTVRTILQVFGTEAMKKYFGEDVWAQLALKNIPSSKVVIYSDWRFEDEVRVMSEFHNVVTVRIVDRNLTTDNHSSERALDNYDFDFIIDNTAKDKSVDVQIDSLKEFIIARV